MDKHCKQQLAKFGMKVEDVTHVCIAPNIYPLLQYMLLMDDDVIFHHTFFFVNEIIPDNVRRQIPCMCFNYFGKAYAQKLQRRILKFRLRYFKYHDFPFLKTVELYAYDLPYLNLCIGKRLYNALSDAPNWLTLNMQETSAEYIRQQHFANTFLGIIQKKIFGELFVHYLGNNSQCKAFYLTEDNISPVLKGKEVHVHSLQSLWDSSSENKKKFFIDLFDITNEDIYFLKSRPNLFFSQPLMNDCGLSELEYIELLTNIFQHYPLQSIIVKPHPRDHFDYKSHFPTVIVFAKSVNSQFLNIVGIKPQRIITISSTAIEGFPETIECDYYGTSVHPKVEKYFGKGYEPKRKVNHINR